MDTNELIRHHQNRCMKYINFGCVNNRCILRGQKPGHFYPPFDQTSATCEEHETAQALIRLQMMEETWEHVRLMFPAASIVSNYYITSLPDHNMVPVLNKDLRALDEVTHNVPDKLKHDKARSLLERVKQACMGGDDPNRTVITAEPLHQRERQLFEEICDFLDGEGNETEGS